MILSQVSLRSAVFYMYCSNRLGIRRASFLDTDDFRSLVRFISPSVLRFVSLVLRYNMPLMLMQVIFWK